MAIDPHTSSVLLTIDEVAAVLRVSKTSVYRLVERRELPFCRVGRSLRFTHDDIETYLQARRVESIAVTIDRHERTQDPGALVR